MLAKFERLAIASLMLLAPLSAQAAIITVDIAGTFSEGHDGDPLDPGFPNPDLAGGSFSGTFTFDDAALPFESFGTLDNFDVLSNFVELRTPANVVDYTITIDGNNQLRLNSTPGNERFIIFLGDSTTTFPDDLRLHFDITGLGLVADGSPLTVAEFITAVSSGTFLPDPFSILDVEGVPSDFTLGIASATVTVRAPVPEPATFSVFGIGLAGFLFAARRRRSPARR